MRALCWHGKSDVRVDTVPDPKIEDPRDAIIKITSTCICGSDLHLYDGYMPTMEAGDILGHEPMGEVVEVGKRRQEAQEGRPRRRAVHDRLRRVLVLPAGQLYSLLRHTPTRTPRSPAKVMGQSPAGPVRLLAHARRLPRRPGRVPPRALRRRRPDQDPRRPARREGRCSSPTSSRPATWPPRTPRSSRATRWPSGAAGRSASSPSRAPGCSAPGG